MTVPPDPSDADFAERVQRSLRDLPDVPEWASQRAMSVWRDPAPSVWRQLTALLRFDSWAAQPAAAMALRSVDAQARQLLFSADGHDFDVRIQREPGPLARFELSGQVLGPVAQGSVAWLPVLTGGSAIEHAEPIEVAFDDMGEFLLGGLPPGEGQVRFRLAGAEVQLPAIVLGASPETA